MSLEFEQKLANELTKLGIHTQTNFRVPGSKLTLDLYIKAPIRGLIEIKNTRGNHVWLKEQLIHVAKHFSNSMCFFLINLDREQESLRNDALTGFAKIWYIDVVLGQKNPEIYCAQKIREIFLEESIRLKLIELKLRQDEENETAKSIIETSNQEKSILEKIALNKAKVDSLKNENRNQKKADWVDNREEIKGLKSQIWDLNRQKHSLFINHSALLKKDKSNQAEIKSIHDQIKDLGSEMSAVLPSVVDYDKENRIKLSNVGQQMFTESDVKILTKEQALNLEKTNITEDSSFKVINVFKVKGEEFKDYFPHLKRWKKPMQVIETDKGWFVDATIENRGATEWEIKEYHNCRVTYSAGGFNKPLLLQKDNVFTRAPIDEDMFGDVLSSFQAFLGKERFKALQEEVRGFAEEFQSGHYTTAVLRIGRTLESVVYNLASSWGIVLNQPTMERIDKLNGQFDKLSKHLIYYYTSDDSQQSKNKEKLKDVFKETNGVLTDMQMNLDENEAVIPSNNIVNIDSLLRDLKNKYAKNENVRNEVNKLIKSKLIQKLYKKRHDAAHADITGLRREFDKKEVKEISENLKEILFYLGNIHDAISKSSP